MTEQEKQFYTRYRALLIEQEKALTEQRAAIIGQRKAIETLLDYHAPVTIHEPIEGETITARLPYTA